EDLIFEQNQYLLSLEGPMSARDEAKLESVRALVTKVRNLTTADGASGQNMFGAPPSYWLDLHAYDPVATARSLHLPIFILQGARDYQVTMVDFEIWKTGLASKTNVSFKL